MNERRDDRGGELMGVYWSVGLGGGVIDYEGGVVVVLDDGGGFLFYRGWGALG